MVKLYTVYGLKNEHRNKKKPDMCGMFYQIDIMASSVEEHLLNNQHSALGVGD